jgi:hypothetical protein
MTRKIVKFRRYLSNFSNTIRNSAIGLAGFCLVIVNMDGFNGTPLEKYAHTIGAVSTAIAGYKVYKSSKTVKNENS